MAPRRASEPATGVGSWPARFGRVVRLERDRRGWSQESLALRADLNRSYLGEIERGDCVPSLATMAKLAEALDARLSVLLARCEAPGPDAAEPLTAIAG